MKFIVNDGNNILYPRIIFMDRVEIFSKLYFDTCVKQRLLEIENFEHVTYVALGKYPTIVVRLKKTEPKESIRKKLTPLLKSLYDLQKMVEQQSGKNSSEVYA